MKKSSVPLSDLDKSLHTEISEVFSSRQGEGPYLGVKQIFVRFGRCNMHCHYCDELEKMKAENFQIISCENLLKEIDCMELAAGPHHSVSLTGGEPLFYKPFLKNFLPKLKEKGLVTYLETNGTLARELEDVIKWCDIIAMDLKPPTSTGDKAFWSAHEAFLKIAIRKDLFIKVVVTENTSVNDIERCVNLVAQVNPKIPFIFQPLSDATGIHQKSLQWIEAHLVDLAKSKLYDVRVIGQMHKIWGVR